MTASDVIQAAASLAGLPVAALAWLAAHRSAHHAGVATRFAGESVQAALAIVEVENKREHRDLFPKVEINCVRKPGHTIPELVIHLKGPDALDRLDRFTVAIRNDGLDRTPSAGGEATQEELDQQIWGPYMLKPYGGGADGFGRASIPTSLAVGERWRWYLQPTAPPRWVTDLNSWLRQYEDAPIRLTLTCEREGYEPWVLRREIPQPQADNRSS